MKTFVIFILLSVSACFAVAPNQTISIKNNTDLCLDLGLTVPERTATVITMTKLKDAAQEMLIKAIFNDSVEEIQKAIQYGANINLAKDGKTPLLLAIILSRYKSIETILQLGAIPEKICGEQAIKMQDSKSLFLLVKYGLQGLDAKQVTGIASTNLEIALNLIKELASRGYNVNEMWELAITLAYSNPIQGEEAVRFLLARGANPNHIDASRSYQHYSPLSLATYHYPNKNIVKILIESGANVNQPVRPLGTRTQACSLLSYATESIFRNPKIKGVIELLLDHGAIL